MVPFFGQGLNCGFEDVRILTTLLLEEGVEPTLSATESKSETDQQLARVLQRYSDSRHDDLIAICDMAMDN